MKKCPNCGACKECGAPQPYVRPYTWPYVPSGPPHIPGTYPGTNPWPYRPTWTMGGVTRSANYSQKPVNFSSYH